MKVTKETPWIYLMIVTRVLEGEEHRPHTLLSEQKTHIIAKNTASLKKLQHCSGRARVI